MKTRRVYCEEGSKVLHIKKNRASKSYTMLAKCVTPIRQVRVTGRYFCAVPTLLAISRTVIKNIASTAVEISKFSSHYAVYLRVT